MRAQEVVNLKWADIDFENRRIEIRKSKTDDKTKGRVGRRIVLPVSAMSELIRLWHHLNTKRTLPITDQPVPHIKRPIEHPESYIFIDRYGKHMTSPAMCDVFTKAVTRAVKRGAIQHEDENGDTLGFHCLRRAANDMFIAARLILEYAIVFLFSPSLFRLALTIN
jgi:integrase